MAGSKEWPRKKPETQEDLERNFYWFPYTISGVKLMLKRLGQEYKVVILFGETYGRPRRPPAILGA